MFKKVLIAEDLDTINIAIIEALQELQIQNIQHTKYCDDALLKIKIANHENQPFELLISDLSFKPDHRKNHLKNGVELIAAVKKEQPNLKVIAYSIEDKSFQIQLLFTTLAINAYIIKGRNSLPELKKAIQAIFNHPEIKISPIALYANTNKTLIEIESYDIELLKKLAEGLIVQEISNQFKTSNTIPFGSSSIEKRINKLKIYFKANNNVHLIAIAKDLGLL